MKKHLLLVCISLLSILHSFSQVSYTAADFGVAGDSLFYSRVVLNNSSDNFSLAGANVSWNFSNLSPTTQFPYQFLVSGTAGYRPSYVTKCIAGGGTTNGCIADFNALTNVAFKSNDSITISTYTFSNLVTMDEKANNSLTTNIIGMTGTIKGATLPLSLTYTQPDRVYLFPITYTHSDSSKSSYEINLTSDGLDVIYKVHANRVNHADAWGSITSPYATYASTVRLRTTVEYTDTLLYFGTTIPVPAYTDVTYSWFATAYTAPVFTASGTIVAGQEKINTVTYLDTVECLPPAAIADHSPLAPTLNGSTGSVKVNFTSSSINANTFYWNFGDPGSGNLNTSTEVDPSHTYTAGAIYDVSLIACNTGCRPEQCDTDNFTVKVYDTTQVRATFIANPLVTCVENTVDFTNNSTNATSYLWEFGDGTSSTLTNPTHTYNAAGSFKVTLYASDATMTDSIKKTITVQPLPAPVIHNTGPLTFCNGDSVTLYASGGTEYVWSTGHIGATIIVRASGSYSVTASNSCGSATAGPVVVTVNKPEDTVTVTGSPTICQGDSVTLQANTGNGLTYQWKRDGNVIVGATASAYEAKTTGNYKVNITQNGCQGVSNIIAVTANPVPVASIYVQSGTLICSGDSLLISAVTANGDSYQWQLNGQSINGATKSTYYAKQAGNYTLVVSKNACSATSNGIQLSTIQTPVPVLTYTGNGSICQGDSLQLSTSAGTGYTYQWQSNGHNIPGATSTFYTATVAASYSVVVTNQGCSGASNSLNLILNPLPESNAGSGKNIVGCGLATVTIGGNPTGSGGTGTLGYSWSPTSGLDSSMVANPTVHNLGVTTNYTVVVTDQNGCSSSATTTVTVTSSTLGVSITHVGPTSWCFGTNDSVLMTAVPSVGGSYLYNWSPATALSSVNAVAATAKPTTPGIYDYTVLITDINGCQASANLQVQVLALPVAAIIALDTTSLCSGDSTHLIAAPGAGYQYQWLDNNSNISGATAIEFATAAAGSYSVSVTSNICSQASNSVAVTVKPQPTAFIAASGNLGFCAGGSALMVASAGNDYTYQWYENGDNIAGATSLSYTTSDSANFYVVVALNGCSQQSNTLATSVYQYPADSIAVIGSPAFCQGDSSLLEIISGTGNNYQWQMNGASINGATSSQLYVSAPGTYYAQVTSINQCTSTSLGVPITVNQYPVASVAPNDTQSFCTGDSLLLTASISTGDTYQWLLNGTPITNANDLYFTAYTAGDYTVAVTQNGCTTQSDTAAQIVVNAYPVAVITAASNELCPGDTMSLYASGGLGYTYNWQLNGADINDAASDSVSYVVATPGIYDAVIISAGCSTTSNVLAISYNPSPVITQNDSTLTATPGLNYQWYNDTAAVPGASQQTFNPQALGGYSVIVTDSTGCSQPSSVYNFTSYTAIQGINADYAGISIYPNPAHNSASIVLGMSHDGNISIQLVDIIGNVVQNVYQGRVAVGNSFYQLALGLLPQGVYLIKFNDDNNIITKKIVKE